MNLARVEIGEEKTQDDDTRNRQTNGTRTATYESYDAQRARQDG